MKTPADCWTTSHPDIPFELLPETTQVVVDAAFWLGASEAIRAIVCGEMPDEVLNQIEKHVGVGVRAH